MATAQDSVTKLANLVQPAYSAAAKRALSREPAIFINNEWVASTGGETIAVEDPSTGKEISRIVEANKADVDRAVAAARTSFKDGRWKNLPPNHRVETERRCYRD